MSLDAKSLAIDNKLRKLLPNIRLLNTYSDLPNNRAAKLIILGGKNTYTTFLGPKRLLIYEMFPSKPSPIKMRKKSFLHGLTKTYTFIDF